jgi:ketosteroid isomerase-like protein
MSSQVSLQVAHDLIAAITAGDVHAVDALYHDDALVFQNTTGETLNKKRMLGIIRFLAQVSELRYEDVRVQPTPTGFVQQHVLCCRSQSGEEVRAHACLVGTVDEGRIRRLDEYLDAASISALTG